MSWSGREGVVHVRRLRLGRIRSHHGHGGQAASGCWACASASATGAEGNGRDQRLGGQLLWGLRAQLHHDRLVPMPSRNRLLSATMDIEGSVARSQTSVWGWKVDGPRSMAVSQSANVQTWRGAQVVSERWTY